MEFFLQTTKSLDYMQLYMTLLDHLLWKLLQKKDLDFVLFHPVFPVYVF